jgi:solute:Na+ symporter, SSS family
MNLHVFDWSILICLFALMAYGATVTRKYSTSVADFLAANRCANRYVLAVSEGAASIGAISFIAWFEAYHAAGFSLVWWSLLMNVVIAIIALSGWIAYRFRQTRALTMAQFLEMRYSKKFRTYAGLIAFVSGTLNFGIFPAVGARFFEYYCGFTPVLVNIGGGFTIDLTYGSIMAVLITIALIFTFMGGQITLIVTEFIQGMVLNIVMAIIIGVLLIKFTWPQIFETLVNRPSGQSMLNPFDSSSTKDFNMWYYLIQAFAAFWTCLAWLGNQGYYVSARNAHEARMGRSLGAWRVYCQNLSIILLPICAFVVLNNADWSSLAEKANSVLNSVSTNPENVLRKQLTTSVALTTFLPTGLVGAFCAVMVCAFLSVQQTYMHSWGSIFVQDILLPLRRKTITTNQHLNLLRLSIFGVGLFTFLFSLFFAQYDAILMFFALTGLLFLGGGGTVIVFGLYWRRGTTAAAYAAMTVGVVAFIFGFTAQKLWPLYHDGQKFPINSQHLFFFAMMVSIVLYVIISLLSGKKEFDLDKMLHRGKYAIADDATTVTDKPVTGLQALFGINKDFTPGDKIIYWAITGWSLAWGVIFLIGTFWARTFGISVQAWGTFWHLFSWMIFIVVCSTTIWFSIGGLIDLKKMFHRLSTVNRDASDDGEIHDTQHSCEQGPEKTRRHKKQPVIEK